MAKRRRPGGHNTLTKIDPATLRQKPPAVSQHADNSGAPVITAINPTPLLEIPPEEPVFFGADTSNFKDGFLEGDLTEEEIVEWYHTAGVSPYPPSSTGSDSSLLGQSTPGLEKGPPTRP